MPSYDVPKWLFIVTNIPFLAIIKINTSLTINLLGVGSTPSGRSLVVRPAEKLRLCS